MPKVHLSKTDSVNQTTYSTEQVIGALGGVDPWTRWSLLGDASQGEVRVGAIVEQNAASRVVKCVNAHNALVDALKRLAEHPAFEGDAPEFNEGGYAYEALQAAK